MNYEDLISKYLDGELQADEDNQLRSEIAQNPDLKSDFDDSIFVHYALKDDAAKLKTPEELKRNTQDLVLMRILKDRPQIIKMDNRRETFKKFIMSAAAVILFGFSYISEYPLLKHLNQLYTYQTKQINSQFNVGLSPSIDINSDYRNINSSTVTTKKSSLITYADNSSSARNDEAYNTASPVLTSKVSTISNTLSEPAVSSDLNMATAGTAIETGIAESNLPIVNSYKISNEYLDGTNSKELLNNSKYFAYSSQSIHNGADNEKYTIKTHYIGTNLNNQYLYNNIYSINNSEQFVNLELNTFYSGNSLYNNVNNGNMKLSCGISQSIGYSINQKHKVGLEFGNMNHSYSVSKLVPVAITPSGKVQTVESPNDVIIVGAGTPEPTVLVPVLKENSVNYIWGGVFYEYNFINKNNFLMDARIGVGGNKLGLMNLSRLTASYRFFNTLNLSVGLDNRMFFINNFPMNDNSKFVNALSVVYGIQLSL